MRELFSINDIAKIFSTPKSTLRFWEEKELIHPERNEENDYRMYDLKELIHVGDIVFYRSLGLPINQLRDYRKMTGNQLDDLLTNAENEVAEELKKLTIIQDVLKDRKEKLDTAMNLSETDYLICAPDFNYLVPYLYKEPFNHASIQENNPYNFALSLTFEPEMNVQDGLVIENPKNNADLIWQRQTDTSDFRLALLKIPADTPIQVKEITKHTKRLEKLGYTVKTIVARYLATINEDQGRFEYYKAWFEVET